MFSRISGWANSPKAFTRIETMPTKLELPLEGNTRGYIPRGLGRSYGDSASNSGGITLESKQLKGIEIDPLNFIATVGAGVTISELERECLIYGLFPYVVPGTGMVTIGGAIASDIHGKSHHRVGSFSNQLIEIKLLQSDSTVIALRPDDATSNVFWATVGGMGLTGMIMEASFTLQKVESRFVKVTEKRVKNLDTLLQTLIEFNRQFLYTVAWVDLSGKFEGRGLVSAADHATLDDLPTKLRAIKSAPNQGSNLNIWYPFRFGIINHSFIRVFNSLWFHKPLGKRIQNLQKYMHPLDEIQNWNVIYGKKGFVQYQFVVPFENEDMLKIIFSKLRKNKCGSFLTVLKSFGQNSNGLIGFPIQGWTLAIDFPRNFSNLGRVLRELDQLVVEAGGRIYLTKDSRMNHNHLPQMYPNLPRWKEIKSEIDPTNHWQSDQGRRLKLC